MAQIKELLDKDDALFYPLTHEKGVVDSAGNTLESKLGALKTISDLMDSTLQIKKLVGATVGGRIIVNDLPTGVYWLDGYIEWKPSGHFKSWYPMLVGVYRNYENNPNKVLSIWGQDYSIMEYNPSTQMWTTNMYNYIMDYKNHTGFQTDSKTVIGAVNELHNEVNQIPNIWTGTQAEYDAITTKDATTLYFIKK